jgi:Uma2 family endonuclease
LKAFLLTAIRGGTMPTTPTVDPLVPPEPSPAPSTSPAVPTLDELGELKPGESRVIQGVDWEFYERLHGIVGERPWSRIAYDGSDVEIMPVSHLHEEDAWFGADLIEIIASELRIPWRSLGSSTWKQPIRKRGIEADQSFYLSHEKVAAAATARARRSADPADYPEPDLVIEVDISQPKVDRPSIYAALRVPEVWRFGGTSVTIERLDDEGNDVSVDTSGFLPIRADEVARWVFHEDSSDVSDWERRLIDWVRAELAGRRAR